MNSNCDCYAFLEVKNICKMSNNSSKNVQFIVHFYLLLCLLRCIMGLENSKGVVTMQYIISGKNIDVTEGLKSAIYDKIGKLERYFTQDTEVHVTLSVEKERQKIEITIPMKGNIVRAEQVSNDMYVSIDLVEEIIERQLRKYKNKLVDQKQAAASLSKAFVDEEIEDDEEIKIIRSKRFAMKPMDPEEACIQMDLLGHNFYVFRNAITEEVNVVYKRKGNTFGLIEPEF